MLYLLVSVAVAWLVADLLSGVIHFIEDRYIALNSPGILGEIAKDNDEHHSKPTKMLMISPWENIKMSVYAATPFFVILVLIGAPLWLCLSVAFTSLANLIHRWSHTPDRQLNRVILFLQKYRILHPKDQHAEHHYAMGQIVPRFDAQERYCVITGLLNPILDSNKVWVRIEGWLSKIGIKTIDKR